MTAITNPADAKKAGEEALNRAALILAKHAIAACGAAAKEDKLSFNGHLRCQAEAFRRAAVKLDEAALIAVVTPPKSGTVKSDSAQSDEAAP